MAVLAMVQELKLDFGFELTIEKGIPLGSGLGGSAASAVAAVVAANALLPKPLSKLELLKFAMKGEAVASGSLHVDNIAPSLFGGLVLTVGIDNPNVKQIPVPQGVRCVLVHPHMTLSTREAREILNRSIDLSDVIWQSAQSRRLSDRLLHQRPALIRASLEDVIIEPQRKVLIPGFEAVKDGAMAERRARLLDLRAPGPTIFAWCEEQDAEAHPRRDGRRFHAHGLESDAWISTLDADGARIVA